MSPPAPRPARRSLEHCASGQRGGADDGGGADEDGQRGGGGRIGVYRFLAWDLAIIMARWPALTEKAAEVMCGQVINGREGDRSRHGRRPSPVVRYGAVSSPGAPLCPAWPARWPPPRPAMSRFVPPGRREAAASELPQSHVASLCFAMLRNRRQRHDRGRLTRRRRRRHQTAQGDTMFVYQEHFLTDGGQHGDG